MPLNTQCESSFDCCMGSCTAGTCCIATGQVCTLNTDCCSGVCKTNNQCM
jgi:hypothetical protein